jgi:hypothetical protein
MPGERTREPERLPLASTSAAPRTIIRDVIRHTGRHTGHCFFISLLLLMSMAVRGAWVGHRARFPGSAGGRAHSVRPVIRIISLIRCSHAGFPLTVFFAPPDTRRRLSDADAAHPDGGARLG